MASFRTSDPCPCTSGASYGVCCRPFHQRLADAPTPTALMRSRYSAFALKELEYLWQTLHAAHPDRQLPHEELIRTLRGATMGPRYTGLRILGARDATPSRPAQVLFRAAIFLKGKDVSFAELSDFLPEGAAWRYAGGECRSAVSIGQPLDSLTLSDFGD